MTLTRRMLVAAGTAACCLPLPSLAQTGRRLRINLIPVADVAPVHIGLKQGYFKDAGLDLVITPSSGGAVGIPGLLGGAFDVIYGNNVSTILALSRGMDIRILSAATEFTYTNAGVASRKADKLKPGKDLEGKTIAVNTRNNAIWLYAYSWIRERGGDPTKVNFKEVPFPQMIDAVRQKQVDGAFLITPFFNRATDDPELEVIGHPYELQPKIQVGLYLCAGKTARENPALVNDFLKGLKRSNAWYDENLKSPELDELVAGYTKLPADIVARIPRGEACKSVSTDELRKTMQRMLDANLLDKPVDVAPHIHTA